MDACSLCCEEPKAWAVGPCDHATCLVCSMKLRVLCEQRDCPVCRERLNKVVVSESLKQFALPPHGSKLDRKYGYYFCTTHLYDQYKTLQANRCTKCRDKPTFGSFAVLREHSRKTHGLVYCDICCENLTLFPFELRQYTRQELIRHRREGDPEDTSYKEHPLCQFCDERFFDNDALHTHLRKVHFWCHFCESDGRQDYFSTYALLRNHFREEHYLCVEGPCHQEKFTSVYRSKLDLQVHRAKVHSKGASKAEARQMRQLDVDFSYGHTGDDRGGGGGVVNSVGGRGQWQHVQQRSRQSKTRDRDYEDKASPAIVQPTVTQRDSRSPPTGWRNKQKTSGATGTYRGQYMNEQPPRMKQKQQQQTSKPKHTPSSTAVTVNYTLNTADDTNTLSSATKKAGVSQAKKPPGFDTSPATVNSDSANEWPDLFALSISSPAEQPTAVAPRIQPTSVSYNPLEPANFPPLSISTLPSTNNNYSAVPMARFERSRASLTAAVASNMPPGLVTPQWQLIQEDEIYKSPSTSNPPVLGTTGGTGAPFLQQQGITEGSVINLVREALNHDREKFNHFRNLSGWYRNGEITVQEYVSCCRDLFGEQMWIHIGPQLAQVMPIQSKRSELFQNIRVAVPPPRVHPLSGYLGQFQQFPTAQPPPLGMTTAAVGGAGIHMSRSEPALLSRAAKWGVLSDRVVPNWESECEYPALHTRSSATGQVHQQPPGLSNQPWKARVPPV